MDMIVLIAFEAILAFGFWIADALEYAGSRAGWHIGSFERAARGALCAFRRCLFMR